MINEASKWSDEGMGVLYPSERYNIKKLRNPVDIR
jgi:hypothetical protein